MSKKEEAFALFAEGKRPSDQEVKDLGLSPKTRFNYYQEFKKTTDESVVDVDEVAELRKKKAKLTLKAQIDEIESGSEKMPTRVGSLETRLQAMAELLAEIVDQMTTIMSNNLWMIDGHLQQFHEASKEELEQWPTMQDSIRAYKRLRDLEPIADNLRKLARRD